jgi:hypothetical protein
VTATAAAAAAAVSDIVSRLIFKIRFLRAQPGKDLERNATLLRHDSENGQSFCRLLISDCCQQWPRLAVAATVFLLICMLDSPWWA